MFDGLLGGKIYGQPAQRTGKNNNTFVVAKLRVPVADGEGMFASLIAFDGKAQAGLLALSDGDAASVAGAVTVKVWTGHQDGIPRPAVDVVVSQVLSVYAIQKKRAKTQGADDELQQPRTGRWGRAQQQPTRDDPFADDGLGGL
ncbi:MAG: single-stranded DNA-binding protein [Rhodoferax sp.]|nr:single-stranded DNA-binding protein [Rhodoferax sp.]